MLSRTITIKQTDIVIEQDLSLSHAGTVWDGALVLAYFLEKNQNLAAQFVKAKNVLQLGSGTGVLGLTTMLFQPKVLYLTDFQQFLPILQRNYDQNSDIAAKQQVKVKIMGMRWGNQGDMSNIKDVDVIIGSQLAYDAENIGYLIQTFIYFCKKNPSLIILISYQKYKNEERNLHKRLVKLGLLEVEEIDSKLMNQEYQDEGIGILIIKPKAHTILH